jgi:hypothetical protein
MTNWWPMTASRLADPAYQSLTTAERLYLEYVISSYSLRGSFYQSDLEIAVTLGLSEDKVRRARRKVGRPTMSACVRAASLSGKELSAGLGWIVYGPGWKDRTTNMATQYIDVPIAKVERGDFFASVPRHTFEVLLSMVRRKVLTHADIAVWLVLAYKYWRCRGKREDQRFFITKKELIQLSGIANASTCIPHLYRHFSFAGGEHLFEYSDRYHRFEFSKWSTCTDPSENDQAANVQQALRDDISRRAAEDKQLKAEATQRKATRAKTGSSRVPGRVAVGGLP